MVISGGFGHLNWDDYRKLDGAKGNRTLDLLNAIQALSHLSYSPALTLDYNGRRRLHQVQSRSLDPRQQ